VATTRPETMFGDIALFVNPNDKRYKQYIGQHVINPVNNKKIPIMADDYIDMQFGTGVMKCTPAHDFHDYDLAKKHNITNYESIMNENGTLNNNVSASFVGLDRLVARPEVVNYLQQKQAIDKIIDHPNEIGYSERTNVVVEPLLSEQWFVKMKPIVADCKKILTKDPCLFLPARFTKTLNQWFNNIEDWCISRQLI
jgi:valyl-tRNA synthetase